MRSLDLASGSVGTYMSVGVIEHFENGPEETLKEARRVLHPDGVALISVPYLNLARQSLLSRAPTRPPDGTTFHQFYFSVEEMRSLLHTAGLELVEVFPYAVEAFLVRERPLVRKLWGARFVRGRVEKSLRSWFAHAPNSVRNRNGHMLMTISRPL